MFFLIYPWSFYCHLQLVIEHALLAMHLFSSAGFGTLHGVPRTLSHATQAKSQSKKAKQQRRVGRLLRDMCEVSSDEGGAAPIGVVVEDGPFDVAFNVCAVEGCHDRFAAALAGGTVAEEIPLAGGVGPAMSHDDADDDAGPAAVAFSDHEGCVADGAAGAGDAEVEAVQRRLIICVKCDKHHLCFRGVNRCTWPSY